MGEIDFRDSPSARATEELSQKSIHLVGQERHSPGAGTFNHAAETSGVKVAQPPAGLDLDASARRGRKMTGGFGS
jgi:hypothetical protein